MLFQTRFHHQINLNTQKIAQVVFKGDMLKPGAKDVLAKLVAELRSPEGDGLKLVVVGHTDDRLIAKKPVREKFADNFRLSTARAHAVGDTLR